MANFLSKQPALVRKAIDELFPTGLPKTTPPIDSAADDQVASATVGRLDSVAEALRNSANWKVLKQQFTSRELEVYESEYLEWMRQLGDDVTHSERAQVHKVCVYKLMQDQNLAEQRRLREKLEDLEQAREKVLKIHPDPEERTTQAKAKLLTLDTDIHTVLEQKDERAKAFNDIESKLQNLFENLKATRQQRLERIRDTRNKSIFDMMAELNDREKREELGLEAARMKRAVEMTMADMGRDRQYADGSWDKPLLNAETVSQDEAVIPANPTPLPITSATEPPRVTAPVEPSVAVSARENWVGPHQGEPPVIEPVGVATSPAVEVPLGVQSSAASSVAEVAQQPGSTRPNGEVVF